MRAPMSADELAAERKWITDTLRRGKERHAKAKTAPGYDPNMLPPTSKLRKAIEARRKPGNTLFDRMLAQPHAKEACRRKQNRINQMRVTAGEVTEEFLTKWFASPEKAVRGVAGRAAALKKKTTTKKKAKRANRAAELKALKGLTDLAIARKLGVTDRTVRRWRGGK